MTKRGKRLRDVSVLASDDIKKLVADWGGFEKLVAELSATGDVTIEHNVVLIGKSRAPRQIDVLLRHKHGLYEHLIIVECKYWNKRVSRLHVDALITTIDELNAAKGVIFSTIGFQSGAITQAEKSGIALFTVRFPTNREWGMPGRHLDIYLQIITRSFANVVAEASFPIGIQPVPLNMDLGDGITPVSQTPTLRPLAEGADYPRTLETMFLGTLGQAAREVWTPSVIADGQPYTRRLWRSVKVEFKHPVMFVPALSKVPCRMPSVSFDLGIRIDQTRITVDRADKYAFVLAVDDHINNTRKTISREKSAEFVTIRPVEDAPLDPAEGPPIENGSILSVTLAQIIPFSEFDGLSKDEISDEAKDT